MIEEHFKLLSKNLDLQSSKCECFHFPGDFNVGIENDAMQNISNLLQKWYKFILK